MGSVSWLASDIWGVSAGWIPHGAGTGSTRHGRRAPLSGTRSKSRYQRRPVASGLLLPACLPAFLQACLPRPSPQAPGPSHRWRALVLVSLAFVRPSSSAVDARGTSFSPHRVCAELWVQSHRVCADRVSSEYPLPLALSPTCKVERHCCPLGVFVL